MSKPVQNIELIKLFANALVVWLVVMGIWPMTEIQQAATLTLALAAVNMVGAHFQSRQTTPLADPKDEDGTPLVRADDGQPTRSAMVNQPGRADRRVR